MSLYLEEFLDSFHEFEESKAQKADEYFIIQMNDPMFQVRIMNSPFQDSLLNILVEIGFWTEIAKQDSTDSIPFKLKKSKEKYQLVTMALEEINAGFD